MSDHEVPQGIATTNDIYDDEDDDFNLQIPLKLELKIEQRPRAPLPPQRDLEDDDSADYVIKHHHEDDEEKQPMDVSSFCKGLSNDPRHPPLAVPMVADSLHQSVSRNDAKQITDSRLKRLKVLSQKPEDALSKPQKDEKKRIIRLEKNRRAAAMSRRKKKMYVKNLENKNKLMERHIAILEMENAQLRALMTHSMPHPHHQMPHFPAYKLPIPALANFRDLTRSNSAMSESTVNPNIEAMEVPSSNKRRKLNDGTCMNTSSSPSGGALSDVDILEPLPINAEKEKVAAPQPIVPSVRYMPMNMSHIHPSRMYHPAYLPNLSMMPNMYSAQNGAGYNHQQQKMNKVEGIVLDKEANESKSEECHHNENDNDIPPEIEIPQLRLSGEFMTMLDEDIIDETVDESGSIMPF